MDNSGIQKARLRLNQSKRIFHVRPEEGKWRELGTANFYTTEQLEFATPPPQPGSDCIPCRRKQTVNA